MDFMKVKEKLVGPAVSIATPMKDNFEIDLDGLEYNVEYLIDNGFINGKGVIMAVAAAGEAPSLTLEERKNAMKVVAETAKGKVPLVTSAQDPSLDNVIKLAKYAEEVGYDAVQISPPFYFPVNAEVIYQFFEQISRKTDIGIMVYNTPWVNRGYNIDLKLMEKLVKIENIVSFKWRNDNEITYLKAIEKFSSKISFLDNTLSPVPAYILGARMYLAIPANFAPKYSLHIHELLTNRRYEEATKELFKLHIPYYEWINEVEKEGILGEGAIIKAPMKMVGLPSGPARPPYNFILNDKQKKRLHDILKEAGLKVVE
ncbi:MAG: dihydrodipicolinate synthase family protein [Nitrososphaeria archaeon]